MAPTISIRFCWPQLMGWVLQFFILFYENEENLYMGKKKKIPNQGHNLYLPNFPIFL